MSMAVKIGNALGNMVENMESESGEAISLEESMVNNDDFISKLVDRITAKVEGGTIKTTVFQVEQTADDIEMVKYL
jgi:hypothetical protein